MRSRLVFAILALALAGTNAAAGPNIKAVEVYGAARLTGEQIDAKLGAEIAAFVEREAAGDEEAYTKLQPALVEKIRAMGDFAYVQISAITYYSEDRPVYVTIDVVETSDKASRLDFLPKPTGASPADPGGLVALWKEYEATAIRLLGENKLDYDFRSSPCPVLHCLMGFEHPELKRFEAPLRAGVAKHREQLVKILREDANFQNRGIAAYLLGHTEQPGPMVAALLPSLRDPSSYVRNNAMRVLGFAVQRHKGVEIPLAPILKAIEYPDTTDRNKALYVLDGIAADRRHRDAIVRQAGPTLVRLLRLRQPNNHDPAYEVLKKISGQTFGDRDYAAWERWLAGARRG